MAPYSAILFSATTRASSAVKATSSTSFCYNQGVQMFRHRSKSRMGESGGGTSKCGLSQQYWRMSERLSHSSFTRSTYGSSGQSLKELPGKRFKSNSSNSSKQLCNGPPHNVRHTMSASSIRQGRARGCLLGPSTINKTTMTRLSRSSTLIRLPSSHSSVPPSPFLSTNLTTILAPSLAQTVRSHPPGLLCQPKISCNSIRCLSSTSTSTYMSWRKRMKRAKRSTDTFMTTPLFPWWSDETSPSHILVHLTFLLTGCAYMSNDMFQLRCVATCSITISVIVLIFMPKVPKTPLLWNAFYLLINLAWCTLIFYERYEASRMDDEFETIYVDGKFEERGFDRVEFRRLFLRGVRKEFPAGHKLKEVNRRDPELMYLAKGGVRVCKEGKVLRQYKRGVFIGEISFLPYLTGETKRIGNASADVIVQPGGLVAYTWNNRMLRDFLRNDRQTRNAVLAFISHDLREKLMTTSNQELALLQGRPVAAALARRGDRKGQNGLSD